MYVLLSVLNGGFIIFSGKYASYASATAELYVNTYPWYHMPLGLHKMLIHGEQVCIILYIHSVIHQELLDIFMVLCVAICF